MFVYTLESVSNITLRGGYAVGLEKGFHNPNIEIFGTTLRACGTTVRIDVTIIFSTFNKVRVRVREI